KAMMKFNNKEKNPKQEEGKLGLETVLKSLADTYLEVLKNLIPELTKSEEPEP
ncbi:3326_t:CDS:1, partial [Gigaspora margarita]